VWNNLNCDIYGLGACLVNYIVYVSTSDVSEALACTVGRGGAVGLIDRERSFYYCDEAGTGMAVPPSLTARLECYLGNIDVRISPDIRVEIPRQPRARSLPAHQVEQAVWKEACRHGG
jgi:hypothetical protein